MVPGSEAARLLPPNTCYGVPTLDLLAAVFLYMTENPYPLYFCITVPLNVSGKRTLQSLQLQLPWMKLFTLGLRCLPQGGTYHFRGALYRGLDIDRSAAFKANYEAHASAYQAGTVFVFAAPTSFSTSDQAAGAFTKGIQFVWPDGHGAKMHDLSVFDDEGEVIVDGPSMFEVTAATMTPTGTLWLCSRTLTPSSTTSRLMPHPRHRLLLLPHPRPHPHPPLPPLPLPRPPLPLLLAVAPLPLTLNWRRWLTRSSPSRWA